MKWVKMMLLRIYLFHDGGHYIETSPLICCANQWTGFYITAFVMKELKESFKFYSPLNHQKTISRVRDVV